MDEQTRPWQVLRRTVLYDSEWVRLRRDDVRLPDGAVIEGHHVVEFVRPAVCVLPLGDDGRILMIQQYRFITDTIGWELPAGRVDAGEEIAEAAERELREETGYRARELSYLGRYHPMLGSTDGTFHIYVGRGLKRVGKVTTPNEVMRVAWFSPGEVWALIEANKILDGMALTALLWHFARACMAE